MQPLSAIDAIAPAFTRTHRTLFDPFRVGRSWKLAATAYVAFAGSAFVPFPLLSLGLPIPWGSRGIAAAVLLLPTLFLLVFFYLGVRMQSVHFEMVVTRAKFIAPMWRRYGVGCWPWIGLKVAIGTAVSLAAAHALFARGHHMVTALHVISAELPKTVPGTQPDPVAMQQLMIGFLGRFVEIVLPFYLFLLAVFLVLKFCSTLLEDFALPFFILDEVSLWESLRRGAGVIARDPLQVALYLLLKFVLSIVGLIGQSVINQIALLPVGIVGFLVGLIGGFAAKFLGAGGAAYLVGAVTAWAVILFFTLWAQIFTLGYLLTLLEAYAIYFLGGRYQKLGDYLEPPSYIYAPPPSPPSKEEEDDGPPLPMDPALA